MKKAYVVEVEEVNIVDAQSENLAKNTPEDSAEACYEIIKEEYTNVVTRSDKLDNKVYITLTFCGFIFLFITSLLDDVSKIKYPTSTPELIIVIGYAIGALSVVLIFVYVLLKLVKLLTPIDIKRFDPNFITDNNLQKRSKYGVYTYTITKYTEAINYNEEKLENKFREYNKCVKWLILIVVVAFMLDFLKSILI